MYKGFRKTWSPYRSATHTGTTYLHLASSIVLWKLLPNIMYNYIQPQYHIISISASIRSICIAINTSCSTFSFKNSAYQTANMYTSYLRSTILKYFQFPKLLAQSRKESLPMQIAFLPPRSNGRRYSSIKTSSTAFTYILRVLFPHEEGVE